MPVKWTYKQAWSFLLGSTLVTLAISSGCYGFWRKNRLEKLCSAKYALSSIIQTGPEKEALKTSYLAELLGLFRDFPVSIHAFDVEKAQKTLRSCPLISSAEVKRMPPSTLYINYSMRKPAAQLADYENIGTDREGYLFPLSPFIAPKQLSEIFLGLPSFDADADLQGRKGGSFSSPLQCRHFDLAFEVLRVLSEAPWREGIRVKRLDVSNAFSLSYGQREILLFTEEEILMQDAKREILCYFPKILRLPVKDYAQQLSNFFSLQKEMIESYRIQIAKECFKTEELHFDSRIIDLRIPKLALIER